MVAGINGFQEVIQKKVVGRVYLIGRMALFVDAHVEGVEAELVSGVFGMRGSEEELEVGGALE